MLRQLYPETLLPRTVQLTDTQKRRIQTLIVNGVERGLIRRDRLIHDAVVLVNEQMGSTVNSGDDIKNLIKEIDKESQSIANDIRSGKTKEELVTHYPNTIINLDKMIATIPVLKEDIA